MEQLLRYHRQGEVPGFLSIDWLLAQFDSDPSTAMYHYRKFVQQGRDVTVWDQVRSGNILGSDEYVNQLKPLLDTMRDVVEISRSERLAARPSLELIFADAVDRPTRNVCIYEATRVHGYTLKKVGNHLGLHYSTISTIAKRIAESETPRKKTGPRDRLRDRLAKSWLPAYYLRKKLGYVDGRWLTFHVSEAKSGQEGVCRRDWLRKPSTRTLGFRQGALDRSDYKRRL